MYRFIVMSILRPTGDEEEEYKLRLKDKEKFWTRMKGDWQTTTYYLLENTLSGLIEDANMLTNITGLFRSDDLFNINRVMKLATSTEDTLNGDDMYLAGDNVGEKKMLIEYLKFVTPSSLSDGGSLGFGSKSKKDFDDDNFIDNYNRPTIEFVEKARKKARIIRKKELENSPKYKGMDRDIKNKKIQRILGKEFPTVKKSDFNPVTGKPNPGASQKWPYWDEKKWYEMWK